MSTNFVGCSNINILVGNLKGDPTNPNWGLIERQINLIQSELDEAKASLAKRDIEALRDDVGDILFTGYGLGFRAGFPVDEDFAEVCRSNMTKFDTSEDDALQTKAKYDALGVQTHYEKREVEEPDLDLPTVFYRTVTYYVTYSSVDQQDASGRSYPAGKYLKSFRFEEPVYSDLSAATA